MHSCGVRLFQILIRVALLCSAKHKYPLQTPLYSRLHLKMGFTPRAGIAILQLIFYIPALIIGVNYGRKKQTAWLDLSLLALTRIVGCSCLLANSKYNLYGLRAVAIIAEAIAVLFVVFLILDLLERL